MNNLYLICPGEISELQKEIHETSLADKTYEAIYSVEKLESIISGYTEVK